MQIDNLVQSEYEENYYLCDRAMLQHCMFYHPVGNWFHFQVKDSFTFLISPASWVLIFFLFFFYLFCGGNYVGRNICVEYFIANLNTAFFLCCFYGSHKKLFQAPTNLTRKMTDVSNFAFEIVQRKCVHVSVFHTMNLIVKAILLLLRGETSIHWTDHIRSQSWSSEKKVKDSRRFF